MPMINRVRRFSAALAAVAVLAIAAPSAAQEISETHLEAAQKAVSAMNRTDEFDLILPQAAQALKAELIQKNPNLQAIIIATVDEKTLELAGRRGDLEREITLAYARVFSEQELNEIATFFASPAGVKLLADEPIVLREVMQAVNIWQRGIARDLAIAVAQVLEKVASDNQPQTGSAGQIQTPVSGGASAGGQPAEGGEAAQ